jgi:hypothetical protein
VFTRIVTPLAAFYCPTVCARLSRIVLQIRADSNGLLADLGVTTVLIVKTNQPTLHRQLKILPWQNLPAQDHTRDRGHARVELRRLQVATVPGLGFPPCHPGYPHHPPGAVPAQPARAHVYAVTSLTAAQAHPARLADYVRGHWGIEALHHLRDTTFAEDASQVRTGTAPRAMASLRKLGDDGRLGGWRWPRQGQRRATAASRPAWKSERVGPFVAGCGLGFGPPGQWNARRTALPTVGSRPIPSADERMMAIRAARDAIPLVILLGITSP